MKGAGIEAESYRIIEKLVDLSTLAADERSVAMRVIHATGDPAFAGLLRFSPGCIRVGVAAVRYGLPLVTDVTMVAAGISRSFREVRDTQVHCLLNEDGVRERAGEMDITRSAAAMDLAVERYPEAIYVIGNAPTALMRLQEHVEAGRADPALVIGMPVGFVMAAESKAALEQSSCQYITNEGTKGGSPAAAAAANAVLKLASE